MIESLKGFVKDAAFRMSLTGYHGGVHILEGNANRVPCMITFNPWVRHFKMNSYLQRFGATADKLEHPAVDA